MWPVNDIVSSSHMVCNGTGEKSNVDSTGRVRQQCPKSKLPLFLSFFLAKFLFVGEKGGIRLTYWLTIYMKVKNKHKQLKIGKEKKV